MGCGDHLHGLGIPAVLVYARRTRPAHAVRSDGLDVSHGFRFGGMVGRTCAIQPHTHALALQTKPAATESVSLLLARTSPGGMAVLPIAEVLMKNRLRVLRAEHNLSQADLADKLDVSRQTVNAIETGRYDPSLPLAFRIAELFSRSIEEIFTPNGSKAT